MRANGVFPRRRPLALWSRRDPVATENVADCLVRHICKRSHDAVVAPVAILSGHPYQKLLEFVPHSGTAGVAPSFGAIELACDKPTIPAQDCVWLGGVRHLL